MYLFYIQNNAVSYLKRTFRDQFLVKYGPILGTFHCPVG